MGKVKGRRGCGPRSGLYVSIPYGKGKADDSKEIGHYWDRYQFPMGKVKETDTRQIIAECNVSIPYGKGKAGEFWVNNKAQNVSIPYGKGKEQHFVLCF